MRYLQLSMMMIFSGFTLYGQWGDCKCRHELQGTRIDSKLTCIVLPAVKERIPKDEVYDQWRFGRIILNSGDIISGKLMHYDGLNDQLIIDSRDPDFRLAVEKHTIRGFDLEIMNSDHLFKFRRIKVEGMHVSDHGDLFLQVLISGKNTLYVYRRLTKTLELNGIARSYVYLIKKEDDSMVSFVKPSRKTITKLFPEKMDLYRSGLRKQHNPVRTEEQLIDAVRMINSL